MNALFSYSLLSVINERSTNVQSLTNIFKEYCETILSVEGFHEKGRLLDLKPTFERYGIDIPIPTLKTILHQIKNSHKDTFVLHSDFSFEFTKSTFYHNPREIDRLNSEIEELEFVYKTLCVERGLEAKETLQYFIDLNKQSVLKFLTQRSLEEGDHSTEFLVFQLLLDNPGYRSLVERLVSGSTLSAYLEIPTADQKKDKTLLLDTNFLVSLSDLHSEESHLTALELLKLAKKCNYNLQVLPETIKEYKNLIHRKAEQNRDVVVFSALDKSTIEFGCMRRGLKSTDLDLYGNKIEELLHLQGITVLPPYLNSRLYREVMNSDIYRQLKDRPHNPDGAIHDAMAQNYVKSFWKGSEATIADIPAFFVTDTQGYFENKLKSSSKLPYIIRTDELLNIIWLSSPQSDLTVSKLNLAKISIAYFDKSLPSKDLLRKIDQKIERIKTLPINPSDCVDIAMHIAQFENDELVKLANAKEESLVRDKIGELAIVARRLDERHRQKRDDEIARMVKLAEEYKLAQIAKAETVSQNAIAETERTMKVAKAKYNMIAMEAEKRGLEALVTRDEEEVQSLLGKQTKDEGRLVVRLRIQSLGISTFGGILLFAFTYYVLWPNWTILESYATALSFFFLFIPYIFAWNIGKRKIHASESWPFNFLNRSLVKEMTVTNNRIAMLRARIDETNDSLDGTLI